MSRGALSSRREGGVKERAEGRRDLSGHNTLRQISLKTVHAMKNIKYSVNAGRKG